MFPKIGVPPKSSILIGFSIINHPFWDTLFLETPICQPNFHLQLNSSTMYQGFSDFFSPILKASGGPVLPGETTSVVSDIYYKVLKGGVSKGRG